MAQPQTIARPYAKAIFDLAGDDAAQRRWQQFLSAGAALAGDPQVTQHMHTPGFTARLEQWLDEWLKSAHDQEMNEQERNFLLLLQSHARFAVLPEIAQIFAELCSQSHNRCVARVKSAQALDAKARDELGALLERKLGKAVALEVEEAPELMAGVVIEYDGQVINQSLQGRLQQFARQLDD